jgi:LmbE family N-acetylglucosaminyl deacetylase
VAARVVSHIRRLKPQVVITFDPIGGYKHPDHIHLHKATVQAFHLAGDPNFADPENLPPYCPQKLYYQTFSKTALRLIVRLLHLVGRDPRRFGRNGDIDLQTLVEDGNFPIHAVIDYRSVLAKRDAAAACHASQLGGGPPSRGVLGWIWNLFGGREVYMRAVPAPQKGEKEKDLFEGVD